MSTSPTKIYYSYHYVKNILNDGTIVYTEEPLNAPAIAAFNDKDIRSLIDEEFITVKDLVELEEFPLQLLKTPKVRALIRSGTIKADPSLKKALSGFLSSSPLALSDPYILEAFDSGAITLEQVKKMQRSKYELSHDILQMLHRDPYQRSNHKSSNPLTVNEVVQCDITRLGFNSPSLLYFKRALEDKSITDLLVNDFITPRQLYELAKAEAEAEVEEEKCSAEKFWSDLSCVNRQRLSNLKIPAVCYLIKSHKITWEQALKINRHIAKALEDKEVASLIDPDIIPLEDFLQLSYEQTEILKIPQVRDYVRTKRFILNVPMLATPIWNIEKAFTDANIIALMDKGIIRPEQVFYMSHAAFELLQLSTVQELLLAKKITAEDVLNVPYINTHYPVIAAFKNPDIMALVNKDLIAPQDLLRISESSHFDTLNDPAAHKMIEERVIEGFLEKLSREQREKFVGSASEDFLTELSLQQRIEFFQRKSMEHFSTILSPQEIAQEIEAKQTHSASMLLALVNTLSSIAAPVLMLLLGTDNTPYESQNTPRIGADKAESSTQPTADETSFLTPQTLIPLAITAGVCAATAVCFWKRGRQRNEPESRQSRTEHNGNYVRPTNSS